MMHIPRPGTFFDDLLGNNLERYLHLTKIYCTTIEMHYEYYVMYIYIYELLFAVAVQTPTNLAPRLRNLETMDAFQMDAMEASRPEARRPGLIRIHENFVTPGWRRGAARAMVKR